MSAKLPRRDGSPSSPARSSPRPCAGVGGNAVSARCSFPDVACGLGRDRRIDAPTRFQGEREQQRGIPFSGTFAFGSDAAAAALYGRGGLRRNGGGSGVQWRLFLLLGVTLAFIAVHFVDPVSSFQIVTGDDDSDEDDEDSIDGEDGSSSNNSNLFGSNHRALPRVTFFSGGSPSSSPFKKTIAARILPVGTAARILPVRTPIASHVTMLRLPLPTQQRLRKEHSMKRLQPHARQMLSKLIAAFRKRRGLSVPARVRIFASSPDKQPVDVKRSSSTGDTPADSPLPISPFSATPASSVFAGGKTSPLSSSSSEIPDSATSATVETRHTMVGGDPGKITSTGHSTIQRFRKVNGELKQTYHRTAVLGRDGELHVVESHHPSGGAGPTMALGALRSVVKGGLGDSTEKGSRSDDSSSSGARPGGPETPEYWGQMFDLVTENLRKRLRRAPLMRHKLNSVLKRRMDLENSLAQKILDEKPSDPEKVDEDEIEDTVKLLRMKLTRRPAVLRKFIDMLKDRHPTALEDLEDYIRHLDIE